jgi:predicted RNase H-like HicB family nuclease
MPTEPSLKATPNTGHPITLEVTVRLPAIALPEADGRYSVLIPALGCATEGDTIEEAQANAVEAAEGWIASQHDLHKAEAIRVARGE